MRQDVQWAPHDLVRQPVGSAPTAESDEWQGQPQDQNGGSYVVKTCHQHRSVEQHDAIQKWQAMRQIFGVGAGKTISASQRSALGAKGSPGPDGKG